MMQLNTRTEPTPQLDQVERPPAAPRKAYERPLIVYRAPLEAMAAACDPDTLPGGKGFGDGTCTANFS